MTGAIRWGILGTGAIAHRFATGLSDLPGAELVAIGSRSKEGAERFSDEFGVPHRHPSYQSLVDDADVDVVHIATPHSFHREHTLLALHAGKAVLCEKPLAMSQAEAFEVVETARERGLFLMEGMWTRFIPLVRRLCELVEGGAIGEIRMVSAQYGFKATKARMFDPSLGGGATLDIGVYPVSLASMILGSPTEIHAVANCSGGIDKQVGLIMRYPGGQIATANLSITAAVPPEAILIGSEGSIRIHAPFYRPSRMTLVSRDEEEKTIDIPFIGNGFSHEASAVMECLREGQTESSIMPLEESLDVMRVIDDVRGQCGCAEGK